MGSCEIRNGGRAVCQYLIHTPAVEEFCLCEQDVCGVDLRICSCTLGYLLGS
jgi:hypothetical protein